MRYLIFILQLKCVLAHAQGDAELRSFEKYAQKNFKKDSFSASLNRMIKNDSSINYLVPLANAYSNKQLLIDRHSKESYYDNLSQTLSFMGDYKAVLECLNLENHSVDTGMLTAIKQIIKRYKGAYLMDAKKLILDNALSKQVIMINEAHCKPVHRTFTYSLLAGLYHEGFRYLAMETLNNPPKDLNVLTTNTGYYTCEPLAGELVRKALSLGFKLVPYEDTSKMSSSRQRDSAQANHLFEFIKANPSAKLLVHAGYGHIQKQRMSDDFVPMAFQFKNISGIDPFCIDQTFMTEKGNDGFSSMFYNQLIKSWPASKASVLFKSDMAVNYLADEGSLDLRIIHPHTTYYGGRATWYSLGNDRRPVHISKARPNSFLIQAYYFTEWINQHVSNIIPADQTYIRTKKKLYTLFLRKGKYHIVFRDMDYRVIKVKTINVE